MRCFGSTRAAGTRRLPRRCTLGQLAGASNRMLANDILQGIHLEMEHYLEVADEHPAGRGFVGEYINLVLLFTSAY